MASSKNNTDQIDTSRPGETGIKMNTQTRNIVVEVSGSRFCIVPSLFKHIENLPWKKKKNNSLKLNANPDVFESVLQFFLSKKLPDPSTLSSRRAKALIEFVSPLDPAAVKPLVNYLQTFVDSKSSSEKNSFVRRSLTTISSPFVARGMRSKPSKQPSNPDVEPTANQNENQASSNSVNLKNSAERPPIFRTNSGTNALFASGSSIPTHIEHPLTLSQSATMISCCSMDESSVSKLSIQSSRSMVTTTQPTAPLNENTVDVSANSSAASGQDSQSQNPFDRFCQPNGLQVQMNAPTAMIQPLYSHQYQGFSANSHIQEENPFSTIMEYRGEYPKVLESRQPQSSVYSNENHCQVHQQTITQVNTTNTTTPLAQTQNLAMGTNTNGREGAINTTDKNTLDNHRHRSATKMLKKYAGTVSSNVSKNLFRKQEKMTHAEWCASASEYIV